MGSLMNRGHRTAAGHSFNSRFPYFFPFWLLIDTCGQGGKSSSLKSALLSLAEGLVCQDGTAHAGSQCRCGSRVCPAGS